MRFSSFLSYILVLLCLFGGGCSMMESDAPVTEKLITDFSRFSQDSTLLTGEWQWAQTACCLGNLSVQTPQSTGETGALVVMENDTVEVYRNEMLEKQESLEDHLDQAQWGVTKDSLVVSWAYIDGPQQIYVRSE